MFKGLGNIAALMKQAQQMGGRMQEIQEQLKAERVTGSAGGGMVEVDANGLGEVIKVRIDPTLQGDREMLEDLIPAAVNQASAKAKQRNMELMQSLTDGLDVPGLNDAISQITGA